MNAVRAVGGFFWGLIGEFFGAGCPRMAAALSYYSIFAMPPLLGLLALGASTFARPGQIREVISQQVETFVGVEGAAEIVNVVEGAVTPGLTGPAAIIGLLALAFGATGVFGELQNALNAAWGVRRDPKEKRVHTFLVKRAISMVMIGALGVLLVVSIAASAIISIFRSYFEGVAPAWLLGFSLPVVDLAVSLVAVSVLVTLILRWVPDAVVRWRDAAVGGLFTGILFTAGKLLIGYYLARTEPGTVFGAAGSLAIALLWVYYSAIILLLGAEFTEAWACRLGDPVVPERGAVRVRQQVVYAEGRNEGEEVETEGVLDVAAKALAS